VFVRTWRMAGIACDEDDFFVSRERASAGGKEKGRDERNRGEQFHRGL
jgi:hypothetical protein